MLAALFVGGAGLASTRNSPPPNQAMPAQIVTTLNALPQVARAAAQRTVLLTITTPGHVRNVAAMALPHNLAVTTTPIARKALITGSIPSHLNFRVTWVGRDETLGFTIVRLGIKVPSSSFAPLPASTSVVAVAPVVRNSTSPPHYAWANTTLGDPKLKANGVVSYLATQSFWNLNGYPDAIAVNQSGKVVAVLSTNDQWFSAQFVALVANIVATGGGALVSAVAHRGASTGHLKPGDVVIRVNGHDIDSWNTLLTVLYLTPAASQTSLTFLRHATTHHTEVILACAL